ncbi:PIG-L deacetylase family protein [Roseibium denhamense]|uniref:N-acetylglucosaminyl deacetylase, LmbE family n=1 Tax=Roseibium denhamense TaxID=76305 RepID=A0ABY1PQG6_9HYPH|nr:PIG-L deacetylase family protein [Roseibium denhamense]SMP37171.1 N-acetylglucosaminyl deacetylase, LmbE family [Roseibium denhamense]
MLGSNKGPVLVVAPHPDDETLGAGGFLLRARAEGHPIHWLIVTTITTDDGWPEEKVARREREITEVTDAFGFEKVHRLSFPAANLDQVKTSELVQSIGAVVRGVAPATLLLPHRGDAHSDHRVVHDASIACVKWFRYPSVKWALVYETLSETDISARRDDAFRPEVFVDVTDYIEEKLKILSIFGDEIQAYPFPRSLTAVKSLSQIRGAASGSTAAEAFMILRAHL